MLRTSENLNELRLRKHMTLEDLAELAGVAVGTASRHCHGFDMTTTQLLIYCDVLGCTPYDLLFGPVPEVGRWDEGDDARLDAELEMVARRFGRTVVFRSKEEIYDEMREEVAE